MQNKSIDLRPERKKRIYDLVGIGIGPFNLGLACMSDSVENLDALFIDEKKSFQWHPGLLLPSARMQVPFYADLITLADPMSKFTYINYLHAKQRLFHFAILENNFPKRMEYLDYCNWAASLLETLRFGWRCEKICFNKEENIYEMVIRETSASEIPEKKLSLFARHIVMGIGSQAYLPPCAEKDRGNTVFHGSEYLFKIRWITGLKSISVIGSGQSGAEIFQDLLQRMEPDWFTRNAEFFPMDYSSFALEMAGPDYIDYFFSLPADQKKSILKSQNHLYKGINASLIREIYEDLDFQSLRGRKNLHLYPNMELYEIVPQSDGHNLKFRHTRTGRAEEFRTKAIILSTGYRNTRADFLSPLRNLIRYDDAGQFIVNRNYSIDGRNSLFVQNAEAHTHGFNASDLGLGPYRNAVILNTILGKEHFQVERKISFQHY